MEIGLTFYGAAQNVTGSRFLVEANGSKVLVDCGLYQERDFKSRNWDAFDVDPASIDAVLLTHAHLDHCGWLPRLVQQGFKGKVYCTEATVEIAKIVLLDSGHIQEEDAEFKKRRHTKEDRKGKYPEVPLYTQEDARACEPLFSAVRRKQPQKVANGIEACFYDAGHILGASMVTLKIRQDGQERTLLFSGDVGRWDKPILRDPTVFTEADYVLVESTYGDRVHEGVDTIKEDLAEVVNSTYKAGGNVVIPSFAVERSQELLYYLNELLLEDKTPHLMVFMDSPMAINVTEVFKNHQELYDEEMKDLVRQDTSPFDLPGLHMSRTTRESKAINHVRGTILVIAGSGMCTGGRIKHHLAANISRRESTLLFVGYQAIGTLGRHIVEGAEEVRILGQKHRVRARIKQIYGFSAHADRDELMRWLSSLERPRKVFVVHGEADAAKSFAELIRQRHGWEVSVPNYQDKVILD